MNKKKRLRAEWEQQSAVLLVWPHGDSDWKPILERITPVYARLASTISRYQDVVVIVNNDELKNRLATLLPESDRVILTVQPTNDTWIRDFGPLCLDSNGKTVHINFRFDAWGGKYDAALDNAVTRALNERALFKCAMQHVPLVLEGGAVETNGMGTLLATRGSIICEKRNPGMDQQHIEEQLAALLGIDHFLWIDCDGLQGDDTDGHIDTIVRFADEETILYATCTSEHPDYPVLKRLEQQVLKLKKRNGTPYRTIPLPCPGIHQDEEGRILPASYANFLITNKEILQPVYAQENDARVIEIMQHCFPGRDIVPIDSRVLIEQNGSIHCATIQTGCPITHS